MTNCSTVILRVLHLFIRVMTKFAPCIHSFIQQFEMLHQRIIETENIHAVVYDQSVRIGRQSKEITQINRMQNRQNYATCSWKRIVKR